MSCHWYFVKVLHLRGHFYNTFSCDIFQVETCGSVGDVGGAPRLLWTSAGALGLPPPSHLLLEHCSSATDRLCRELCDQHCDQRQNQNNLNILNSDYKSSPLRQPRVVPMSLSARLVQEEVFPGEKICGDFFEMGWDGSGEEGESSFGDYFGRPQVWHIYWNHCDAVQYYMKLPNIFCEIIDEKVW